MGSLNEALDWDIITLHPLRCASNDFSWVNDEIYRTVAKAITPLEAQRQLTMLMVKERRRSLRGRANKILADIGVHRTWPPEWPIFTGGLPIVVGSDHVQLRAVSAGDLEQWAIEQGNVAAIRYAATMLACDGAQWVAEELRRNGWGTIPDLPPVQR